MTDYTFSGSYAPEDVTILLRPADIAPTPTEEKERLIQSGERHYSEMLAEEKSPDAQYMEMFWRALELNERRFAADLVALALRLSADCRRQVVLASIARAGTPVGVLLHRMLRHMGTPSVHYSLSAVRDKGIDLAAVAYILDRHDQRDVVFVDGWTGKGAIQNELNRSVGQYNAEHGTSLNPGLVVVSDLAGVADLAAGCDDYLIPSAVLNSIVSGLISRSVRSKEHVLPGQFHACVFYEDKRGEDLSVYFVDRIFARMLEVFDEGAVQPASWTPEDRRDLRLTSDEFMSWAMARYGVNDVNRVKPGIGESTRALLRRVPDRLIVQDEEGADVAHLLQLATTHGVTVEVNPSMPYRAAVVIKTLGE